MDQGVGSEGAKRGAPEMARGEHDPVDEGLFLRLKELRGRLAQEIKAPAYIVFSDASLRDMCRKRPRSPEQFLNVAGVGAVKLEKYGAAFMAAIGEYGEEAQT